MKTGSLTSNPFSNKAPMISQRVEGEVVHVVVY